MARSIAPTLNFNSFSFLIRSTVLSVTVDLTLLELTQYSTALLEKELNQNSEQKIANKNSKRLLSPPLDKQYFIEKYGSLKKTKAAYNKAYGNKKYGKSWQDFLAIAAELPLIEQPVLTLEARIARIENILITMGYKL